jgi:hypothetical protein
MCTVVIDLDGVIVDSIEESAKHETEIQLGDYTWFERAIPSFIPIKSMSSLVDVFIKSEHKVHLIFLTARSSRYRRATRKWLSDNIPGINKAGYLLLMRPLKDDLRPDFQVKSELLRKYVVDQGYQVDFAIDDLEANIDMYLNQGIDCLHFKSGQYRHK